MNLETERLFIRSIKPEDQADYFEIFSNPAIAKFDDFPLTIDLADAVNDMARIRENYATHSGDQEYAVVLKEESKLVGVLAYRIEDAFVYVGYHFNAAYHGRGYATEAMRAFLPWLIATERMEIRAAVDPQNHPSIKVLEKLGFQYIEMRNAHLSRGDGEDEELIYGLQTSCRKF
jgi:[ribosomal protein S5]-alanine N-acetyltransferase